MPQCIDQQTKTSLRTACGSAVPSSRSLTRRSRTCKRVRFREVRVLFADPGRCVGCGEQQKEDGALDSGSKLAATCGRHHRHLADTGACKGSAQEPEREQNRGTNSYEVQRKLPDAETSERQRSASAKLQKIAAPGRKASDDDLRCGDHNQRVQRSQGRDAAAMKKIALASTASGRIFRIETPTSNVMAGLRNLALEPRWNMFQEAAVSVNDS
jgi:hypothetical protein